MDELIKHNIKCFKRLSKENQVIAYKFHKCLKSTNVIELKEYRKILNIKLKMIDKIV